MAPPKGKKGQTMSLADFAKAFKNETPTATNTIGASWADEDVELPSAPLGQDRVEMRPHTMDRPGRVPPRRLREEAPLPVVIDQRALPREPPFVAFMGNLASDATEDDIKAFFQNIAVKGIRFPRGESGHRGYCYVEFLSVEGLTEALMKSGQSLKGRPCRVDIATPKERDSRLTQGDWRAGHKVVERSGPAPPVAGFRRDSRPSPGSSTNLPKSNWRETAKPVEATSTPTATPTLALRSNGDKSDTNGVDTTGHQQQHHHHHKGQRPDLKLKPRTKPAVESEQLATEEYSKSTKPNPFGQAKPRELVLAQKKDTE